MNRKNIIRALLVAAGFVALSAAAQNVPVDQMPMYGGMDRSQVPALKEGDEKFISSVVAEFGSREKASMAWVNRGFTLYQQDDLAGAMRRFNQAWLLNPNNAEVYWGFASVLTDRNKYCEALKMVELAQSKSALQPGFIPDAALIYTGCAVESKTSAPELWDKYLARSDALFAEALASPAVRKQYTLFHWARAMYGRGDYAGAWAKVAEFKKETGKDFDAGFIRTLSQKMPEPK
ncbi:MAG TPA: hypothetical protein VF928_14635 [Usitatibacteraceae bacterium]